MVEYLEEKFVSCPGSRYRDIYTPHVLKDGSVELVVTGKEDLWELYNANRDSCDLNKLVERFEAGDVTALQRGNPVFMDLLGAPKSLAEAYALTYRAEAAFDLLPSSIREKFDSDFSRFLSTAGSDEWFAALKIDQNEKKEGDSVNES